MADGNLEFDTSIDLKGFDQGCDSLESTIKELKDAIEVLSVTIKKTFNINTDKTTNNVNKTTDAVQKQSEELKKQEGIIDKVGEALDKAFDDSVGEWIAEEAKSMAEATGVAGSFTNAMNRIKGMFHDVSQSIMQLFKMKNEDVISSNSVKNVDNISSKMMLLQEQLRKAEAELANAEQKLIDFSNQQIPTQEYTKLETSAKKVETELLTLLNEQEKFIDSGGSIHEPGYLELGRDIDVAESKLKHLENAMQTLKESNKAFSLGSNDTGKMQKLTSDVINAEGKVSILKQRMQELADKEGNVESKGATSFPKIGSMAGMVVSKIKSLEIRMFSLAKTSGKMGFKIVSALNPVSKLFSKTSKSAEGLTKKLTGMLKRVFVFTVITKVLREIKTLMSNIFTKDSEMSGYFAQIKGNLYTAFAPIYEYVLPGIKLVMSALAILTSYLANVSSAIFGKTIAQSKALGKSLSDQARSTDETAKATKKASEQLASFDELNVRQDNDNDSGSIKPVFNAGEMNVGWVEQIKKMISSDDWEGIGILISDKMADMLEKINWQKIQTKIKKTITNFTRILNGFFANMQLAWNLGTSIAQLLNTGFLSAYTFLTTFDFTKFGAFIGASINGAVKKFDWGLLGNTVGAAIQALIDSIYGFVTTYKWGTIGSGLSKSVNKMFKTIDWSKAGKSVGEGITGIFNECSSFLAGVDWFAIGRDIADFFEAIDWGEVAASIFKAFGAALAAGVALLLPLLRDLGQFIIDGFSNGIIEGMKDIGKWIKKYIFDPFIEGFKKAFDINSPSKKMMKMGEYITEGLKEGVKAPVYTVLAVFEGIRTGIIKIVNGIIKVINGMISGICSGINALINLLNSFHVDIPKKLSKVMGIDSIGFNINTLDSSKYHIDPVPLAKGAVIPPRAPFIAELGDQKNGTNIETPLDTMIDAFKEALRSEEAVGSGSIEVNVYLEGDANGLFKSVKAEAKKYKNRTGTPAFV